MPIKPTYEALKQRVHELEQAESELAKAMNALQDSEAKFRLLYERSPIAYQSLDIHGHLIEVNQAWLDILGYDKVEVIGKSFGELLHPDWVDHFKQNFPKFKAVGEVLGVEFEMIKKNGAHVLVTFEGKIGKDRDGNFQQTHCVLHDITKRRQTEERIKESESRFRTIFEQAAIGVALVESKTGRFLRINQRYCDMVGFSIDEMAGGKSFREITHPEDIQTDSAKMAQLIAGEIREFTLEKRYYHKNGSIIWVNLTVSSMWKPGEEPNQHVAVVQEITKRKRAEEALRLERDRAQKYLDTVEAIIVVINREGQVTLINQKGCSLLGYSENDLIGRNWFSECLPQPEGMEDVYPFFIRLMAGEIEIAEYFENPVITRNGELRQIAWHNALVYDEKGIVTGALSAGADITDRKIAESALRESEDKYRSLIESTSDWVWSIDVEGVHTYSNDAIKKSLGYSHEEIIGSSAFPMMHPDDARLWDEKLRKCVDLRIGWKDENIRWLRKSGETHFFESSANPILDTSGNVVGFRGVDRDITERKKLEARLLQAQKMEAIGNLAGGIAHDFNNILSAIIGFTELAMDDTEKDSMIQDNLEEVYLAGQRAKELVAQILAFARQSEEELKPIKIDSVVKEVVQFIRSSIPTTIEIKSQIDSNSKIMGNHTQIHQILMNLCTNAAHAMEDIGGVLTIGLRDTVVDKSVADKKLGLKLGDYLEIAITDTGAGIPSNIIGSIFDPYFTTKGPGEGTGMGLAVVHGIVESYGGKISVESEMGGGTTFTIYLPVTRKRKSQHQYEPEQLPTGNERILFIDDEASIAKMGSQSLERLGYKVTTRTSSIEALELFRSKPNDFDLVITDMTMPNMTGEKLALELMNIRPKISVVLCTGYSNNMSDEIASEIGIKAFVYKPIVNADLAKIVRNVLDDR